MTVETYRLRAPARWMSVALLPFFLVVGFFVFFGIVREGMWWMTALVVVWLAAAGYQGWYSLWRMPTSVEVCPEALRLVARSGVTEIAWPDLQSVKPPAWNFNRQTLVWRWRGGKLRSWAAFESGHRMFTAVEQRAPQADVSP